MGASFFISSGTKNPRRHRILWYNIRKDDIPPDIHLEGCITVINETAHLVLTLQADSDIEKRNDFIRSYFPFIIGSVSKTTGHYVNTEDSDEFCIGLEAFNEAIDKYNAEKGTFIGFADLVIRSRVTDFMRKEWKFNQDVDLDEQVLLREPVRVDEDLILEINAFKEKLSHFDITLDELAEDGPKHKTTRVEVTELGQNVSRDEPICGKLYSSKKLPMAEIVLRFQTTKKRLKTYRSFIIGVIVIFREKLEQIGAFLSIRGDNDE